MPRIIIRDIAPRIDGEYDFDIASFTNRELHLIKQETGVRAGELSSAFAAGDNDLIVAITLIVLRRAGKGDVAATRDAVWDADAGQITWDFTDLEEDDAVPPASEPSETDALGSDTTASGDDSDPDGDQSPSHLSPTGVPV